MLSRHLPDEQCVFTREMDEVADRLSELLSMLQVLADRARGSDDLDMHFVLGAASRIVFGILRDVVQIDEVLRRRGAIVDAYEYLRNQHEQQGSQLEQELQ
jgi:nitrogen-specific signal transduction histidine kinase